MKLISVTALLGLATPALFLSLKVGRGQDTYPLWYEDLYDQPGTSLSSVICSNGGYGLMTRFDNFSQIPTYPAIGGIPMISQWDSSNCGTCWQLSYTDATGTYNIAFTAINTGQQNPDGFTISKESMDFLTNGKSDTLDGTTIHVAQMLGNYCNLPE